MSGCARLKAWNHFQRLWLTIVWANTTPKAGETKKKWGSFTRYTLPSHPFAAELRHQLWWCAVLFRAPRPDAEHSLTHRGQYSWTRTCLQNYPVVPQQTKAAPHLNPFSLDFYAWTGACKFAATASTLLSGLLTGFVVEVRILAVVPIQKWLDFPLCHATSADNKRERGTKGEGRGRGDWWLPWQPLSFLQLRASD